MVSNLNRAMGCATYLRSKSGAQGLLISLCGGGMHLSGFASSCFAESWIKQTRQHSNYCIVVGKYFLCASKHAHKEVNPR